MREVHARATGAKAAEGGPRRSSDEAPPRQLGPPARPRREARGAEAKGWERSSGMGEVLEVRPSIGRSRADFNATSMPSAQRVTNATRRGPGCMPAMQRRHEGAGRRERLVTGLPDLVVAALRRDAQRQRGRRADSRTNRGVGRSFPIAPGLRAAQRPRRVRAARHRSAGACSPRADGRGSLRHPPARPLRRPSSRALRRP
jgi:hypothetical protein